MRFCSSGGVGYCALKSRMPSKRSGLSPSCFKKSNKSITLSHCVHCTFFFSVIIITRKREFASKSFAFCGKHAVFLCFSHRCEGVCRLRAAGSKGIFSFAKENIPFGTPRERLLIGSLNLEWPLCLRNGSACARRCRVDACYTIWCASIIRCRSASLVVVQPNSRLPPVPRMRRAQ